MPVPSAAAVAACLILAAIASFSALGRDATADGPNCHPHIELPDANTSRVLVFGEMHGSVEAPSYFASVACAALRVEPKRPLVVVLEFPTSEDDVLQHYLRSGGTEADIRSLLGSPFWSRTDGQDGRTSKAMFELVETLRVFAASHPGLGVATLVPANDGVGSHDARMARQLDAIIDSHADARILVLVGNLHARRHPAADVGNGFRSMVDLSRHRIHALAFRDAGGDIWACMESGCGVHAMRERPEHINPIFDLRDLAANEHYDGLIDVGRYTASPPAYGRFETSASGAADQPLP